MFLAQRRLTLCIGRHRDLVHSFKVGAVCTSLEKGLRQHERPVGITDCPGRGCRAELNASSFWEEAREAQSAPVSAGATAVGGTAHCFLVLGAVASQHRSLLCSLHSSVVSERAACTRGGVRSACLTPVLGARDLALEITQKSRPPRSLRSRKGRDKQQASTAGTSSPGWGMSRRRPGSHVMGRGQHVGGLPLCGDSGPRADGGEADWACYLQWSPGSVLRLDHGDQLRGQ